MATYDIPFNVAKGRVAELALLAQTADAFVGVVIETTGIVNAATMRDYGDLNALIAGASNEQTTMGRKTLTSVLATVDNTNDRVDVDAADPTWVAASGNPFSALVICYDYDTGAGTDSSVVPMVILDFIGTPGGSDIVLQFATNGFFRAS